ncbi:MAG: hypothetical protein COV48_10875 [Elusimicrobia bacterium CG11_big_fil_rev_8_21_14_0_20_64_6]|nr:MAG: hypothetical protein COV48_10875 [Elusimicrobia bacterium CG11_big_fil_rev_8_21_14_0_20_64_6]
MKTSGLIAVLLSVSIPGSSFAQNLSSARAGSAAQSSVSGAAGTVQIVPNAFGSLTPLSMTPGLMPAPGVTLSAAPAAFIDAPSAIQVVGAIPALPAALAAVRPAAAQPLKTSEVVLAAMPAASSAEAGAKTEAASKTWTEKLASMFDGSAKKSADTTPLDPANLKAFVIRHGQPMTEISLAEASALGGQVRLLTAKNDPSGLTEKHAAQIGALVRGGATKAIEQEKLAVDWSAKPTEPTQTEPAAPKAGPKIPASLSAKLLWPFREAKFLAKAFASSLVKPLPSEILGGLATKSFPLVTSIGVYWAAASLAHPVALVGLITLSVAQQVFHGFFLKSWNNFQEILRTARGFNYQMFFNLAYMQGSGTLYRLLTWSANPTSVTPPWSINYWKDMALMSVIGTFFGVLGYNALNALYAKGSINRWQHSGIQQVRDLCFLLAAPFFASGSMTMFWGIFLFQQSLDLAIALWAGYAKARPIVFVTSAAVASSAEFNEKYPLKGVVIEPPLKQALKAVIDNPLVRVMTWPARALWKLIRGGKK